MNRDLLVIDPLNWSYFMQTETFKWNKSLTRTQTDCPKLHVEFEQLKFWKKNWNQMEMKSIVILIKWNYTEINWRVSSWWSCYFRSFVHRRKMSHTKKQTSFKINTFLLKHNVLWSQSTTWSVMIDWFDSVSTTITTAKMKRTEIQYS